MSDVIYAIMTNKLDYTGLRILDVKIGKTGNIESTLSVYRRSVRGVKVLNLWNTNEQLTLSRCESGVKKLAIQYAHSKEGEKFVFLHDGYDKFSEHVSLLLKEKYGLKHKKISRSCKTIQKGKSEINRLDSASDDVKKIFEEITNRMISFDSKLVFNPKRYYISIKKRKNFALIKIRKTKLRLVVFLPVNLGRKIIKLNEIEELSQSVQDFYGSECFTICIEKNHLKGHLNEVIKLLKKAYEYNK